jgi:hypothetical protein
MSAGRTHKELESGMAFSIPLERVVPNAFSLFNQEPGQAVVLVMDALAATSLQRPNIKPPAGIRISLSRHCQPAKNRWP